MKKRALYIGRFQPFHNGHLDAIEQIVEHEDNFDELIIGIGSAENDYLPDNPLTAGERFELLTRAIDDKKFSIGKIWIFPIRNINQYSLWPHHVIRLCPEFDTVFTGSEIVQKLFQQYTNKKVSILEMRVEINASKIREMVRNNQSIENFIPSSSTQYLEEIGFQKRLQAL